MRSGRSARRHGDARQREREMAIGAPDEPEHEADAKIAGIVRRESLRDADTWSTMRLLSSSPRLEVRDKRASPPPRFFATRPLA